MATTTVKSFKTPSAVMRLKNTLRQLGLAWFVGLLATGCQSYYVGPVSDHFDGERFYNPGKPMHKSFADLLKWRMTAERGYWPPYRELQSLAKPPPRVNGEELRITMVGHATVLIQTQGLNILTDPVWSERASPLSWLGPRRVHPPGITFADLPPVDVVLVSHNHYDHLDLATLARLWQRDRPRIIVPLGNDTIIRNYQETIPCEAYDWGDAVRLNGELTVHLEPMHHWSARSTSDRNYALWAAFVLTGPGGNIYFVGDSGYGGGDYFRAAKEKFANFRLALLPIGAYEPRWFMAYGHMNPRETVLAFHDLGEPWVLPTHHMVFALADTGYSEPLTTLQQELTKDSSAEPFFRALRPGEVWLVPRR